MQTEYSFPLETHCDCNLSFRLVHGYYSMGVHCNIAHNLSRYFFLTIPLSFIMEIECKCCIPFAVL